MGQAGHTCTPRTAGCKAQHRQGDTARGALAISSHSLCSEPLLLTGSLGALLRAILGIAVAHVHWGAAPRPRLGAAEGKAEPPLGTCHPQGQMG